MRYSIFILLILVYTLLSAIAFFVIRAMRRETKLAAAGPVPAPEDETPQEQP